MLLWQYGKRPFGPKILCLKITLRPNTSTVIHLLAVIIVKTDQYSVKSNFTMEWF
jgi:hypothetical protein